MDSGCFKSVSPCASDFVPGSLVNLPVPLAMDGIAGQLIAHQQGRLQYKVLNDAGGVTILECNGFHLPDLKIRLFSPQAMLAENKIEKNKIGKYVLEWNKSCLELGNGDIITIGYHQQTVAWALRTCWTAWSENGIYHGPSPEVRRLPAWQAGTHSQTRIHSGQHDPGGVLKMNKLEPGISCSQINTSPLSLGDSFRHEAMTSPPKKFEAELSSATPQARS
jgi:hypothetical protein